MEFRHAEERLWEKILPDGSNLIGITGSGSHTHIGSDFVSIRDEATGADIRWDTPQQQELPDHYQMPDFKPKY